MYARLQFYTQKQHNRAYQNYKGYLTNFFSMFSFCTTWNIGMVENGLRRKYVQTKSYVTPKVDSACEKCFKKKVPFTPVNLFVFL